MDSIRSSVASCAASIGMRRHAGASRGEHMNRVQDEHARGNSSSSPRDTGGHLGNATGAHAPGPGTEHARRGVAAIIPAYQAERHLETVLRGVREHLDAEAIFVVDDGSTDGTAAIAQRAGVRIVQHPMNRGKGAALATGFRAVAAAGFTHVLTIDADGQHPPGCIPDFLAARERAEILIGWRLHDAAAMPPARRLSNRATAAILSSLAGQTILDGQSGYRLLALHAIASLPLRARGFMLESELLVRAARAGARIDHVPIPCVYGDETSHIHVLSDTARFLWLVARSFFW
jgi:glycosyltransferase involved in cell wall biosynthesis